MSRNIRYDYVGIHYKDVEDRFTKVFKVYQEEHYTEDTQSPEHVPFQAFESPVKQTYMNYEDDVRQVAEATGGHFSQVGSQTDEVESTWVPDWYHHPKFHFAFLSGRKTINHNFLSYLSSLKTSSMFPFLLFLNPHFLYLEEY